MIPVALSPAELCDPTDTVSRARGWEVWRGVLVLGPTVSYALLVKLGRGTCKEVAGRCVPEVRRSCLLPPQAKTRIAKAWGMELSNLGKKPLTAK